MSCVRSGSTDRAELVSRLDEAAVAYAQVNDCGGLAEHPALRRVTVDSEVRPQADRPPLAGSCVVPGHDREMMARWLVEDTLASDRSAAGVGTGGASLHRGACGELLS